jgi:hypothetical protein
MTVMLQVYRPSTYGKVVWSSPCVSCEVKKSWILLQQLSNDALSPLERSLDIVVNSVGGWELEFGSASGEQFLQLMVTDDIGRASAFCDPFNDVGMSLRGRMRTV